MASPLPNEPKATGPQVLGDEGFSTLEPRFSWAVILGRPPVHLGNLFFENDMFGDPKEIFMYLISIHKYVNGILVNHRGAERIFLTIFCPLLIAAKIP